ncbi:helix-turn-helix domain-containing protein [Micromonospora sp. NPDC051925]|uniref:helix-turn-helix domain-containing protein n=1 Tax=Micromonospora sp. NPDC051925 TaxID=3364288 RepID=UPI0037CA9111
MTDPTAAEVRRLRAEEGLSVRQIQARTGLGRNRVYALLRGVPPPAWTRRPTAKDGLRAAAVALRGEGCSVNDIATRLGVAKSTAYLWVKHAKARSPNPGDAMTMCSSSTPTRGCCDCSSASSPPAASPGVCPPTG